MQAVIQIQQFLMSNVFCRAAERRDPAPKEGRQNGRMERAHRRYAVHAHDQRLLQDARDHGRRNYQYAFRFFIFLLLRSRVYRSFFLNTAKSSDIFECHVSL